MNGLKVKFTQQLHSNNFKIKLYKLLCHTNHVFVYNWNLKKTNWPV
jgi:hypothetical protein